MSGPGNIDTQVIARLVVRAPNWLGDAVMALPALAAVRDAFPRHLTIAAIPSIAPLFLEDTAAAPDAVVTLSSAAEEPALLRAGAYDAALLLTNSFRTAWAARRAGIPERWGYATSFRGPLLARRVRRSRQRLHQSAYYLELVRGLGVPATDTLPRVRPTPGTAARAAALLDAAGVSAGVPLVGLAPGAAYGHAKRWPPVRVAELIARLTRERQVACVLVGAAQDRQAAREIESALPPDVRPIDLIGRTDLRVLAGVLTRCSAFVSNDSGAMHLAAAAGVPVVAIFGPTDERATAPLGAHDVLAHPVFCRPCMLRECPIDHRCMKRIGVERVFEAVSRRLEVRT